ncbi:vWA domain-containing protein [Allorhodopirellula solitaria]|uniref:von Willebrand factor type A domain protein n=1 Tax=Allorhodopirellula solitaria TaxID=2527987 RepID=A0A5C5YJK9_9BACT|nr:VWA domain-containing protein [Allorhodopirellula solitaria]TWT75081.1 von Willebrand factor type A domain protein [Allorhodopirellula solitaria]
MDIQFGSPGRLYLLLVVAAGLALTLWAIGARSRAFQQFATDQLGRRLLPRGSKTRHWLSGLLVAASLTLLVLALTDLRWGKTWREVPQKGIEVIFVLDVSRSMLAEDAAPNRLVRAKEQIKDMLDTMQGDRVGLVTFAGESRQSVPLTSHYEDFKQTLDSVGPHSVRSGGSRLGDALTVAANGFLSELHDHKAIVVFTDGEDQESNPVDVAANLFTDQGIRIFTVGLGDIDQGARVPESEDGRDGYVQYQGEQVWSKLNGQVLAEIAEKANGAYIPAGTRRVNMADVYHRFVGNVPETSFESAKINAYIARYQWFAVPALVLLMLEVILSTRSIRSRRQSASDTQRPTRTVKQAA